MREYQYNPLESLKFQGAPRYGLYFGVELEVERKEICRKWSASFFDALTTNSVADQIEAVAAGFAICKYDGTLRHGYGIEVVTAPADLETHRREWVRLLSKENRQKWGLMVSGRCGMHVHFSRAPLQPEWIGGLAQFVGEQKELFVTIAGRESPRYAAIIKKDPTCVGHVCGGYPFPSPNACLNASGEFIVERHNNRYDALNVTKADTVELRVFASTTRVGTLMRRLEFTAGLVWYMVETKGRMNREELLRFIWANRKELPRIARYLKGLYGGVASNCASTKTRLEPAATSG